jgi:glycosyltransferase involved in cell wall biosynthesis
MGTANYKVSVIIPTYNRSNYVLDAIQSVIDQKYESVEILVIDDGSTDDTKEKLAPLHHSGVIRYIYQENQERSAARNRGILLATGEYLAFLDSDDLLEANAIAKQVQFLSTHPEVGLVHGGYIKFDSLNHDLGYRDPSWFSGWVYPDILLIWYTLLSPSTVMVPKRVLDEVGGFDENLFIAEDLDLWRRIARKYPFGYINQSLARLRVHPGNTSRDALKTTPEFERYLEKAFDDDKNLSPRFKNRVLSRLYTNQAYIMLSGRGNELMLAARELARRAISHDPLNIRGYTAFLSTALSYDSRTKLVERWRSLRGWLMSLNRKA